MRDYISSLFSTHSNRRTWATKLDKAGVRLKTIQDLGG